jgi:hypothetical protein
MIQSLSRRHDDIYMETGGLVDTLTIFVNNVLGEFGIDRSPGRRKKGQLAPGKLRPTVNVPL